ncbi:DUF1656 domain-containing protein [Variovorax sp. J22P240]|uniref:DUF1656 domain-containing protein n=1 Tax=Variovorax TaxID=34072 RepID=UPI0025774BCA|nr:MULTISPECIES: DUF1656 domain-containing protein [unclassified Variovorax]MDM0001233.1 DUF1656 domain-containing protein [Variovorax sp. J22P240]MDM0049957.1 DUF1656 domain-containing protein [Variovorax sp. J22R115]MDM0110185.1 DUF1656 domain-containing protein [Variovorax sp. J22R24]
MITDLNLFGLFISAGLATALLAASALAVVARVMAATGAYRWVWHPPLFNLALFGVLWLALAMVAAHFQNDLAFLLG